MDGGSSMASARGPERSSEVAHEETDPTFLALERQLAEIQEGSVLFLGNLTGKRRPSDDGDILSPSHSEKGTSCMSSLRKFAASRDDIAVIPEDASGSSSVMTMNQLWTQISRKGSGKKIIVDGYLSIEASGASWLPRGGSPMSSEEADDALQRLLHLREENLGARAALVLGFDTDDESVASFLAQAMRNVSKEGESTVDIPRGKTVFLEIREGKVTLRRDDGTVIGKRELTQGQ